MKQKLYSLLLTVLLGMTGMNAWAQSLPTTTIDGKTYYEIASAEDMATLSEIVNSGEFEANAVLTTDIDMADLTEMEGWTAIGDWGGISGTASACYKGHFNGQGHTITGFNATSSHNYYGIFGVVSTGTLIENFTIYGTLSLGHKTGGVVGYSRDATPTIRNIQSYLNINCTEAATTAQRPGGILGTAHNGTTVIENCTYSGTLNVGGHTGNIGGIVGYVNNNTAAIVNITNCLFDGKILNGTTAEGQCGGIVGYNNSGVVTIKNCLSIGTIETKEANDGMFFGRLVGGNSTFINNYYVGEHINGTSGSGTANGSTPIKVTAEQLASGEIAYALNGNQSEDVSWFQTLKTDNYPTPNGKDVVYPAGRQHCDGTAYEGVTGFSNTASVQDDHDFAEGFCTYCGALDETYLTTNGEGFFELGTANQLKWFAAYVNQVSVAANAVLTADIALTSDWTTPIGIGSGNAAPGATAYAGIFDGQGHAITGFNAEGAGHLGLFGDASGATIKNFSISGNLTVTGGYGGGVVAWPISTTIENVHSALVVSVPNSGTHHIGGVVGSARGNNTIDRCSFTGSLTVAAGSTDNFAGIVAYITNGDKVTNCANYGDVTFSGASCAGGGIVGYVNSTSATVKNCLTVGTILFDGKGDPKYGAAILGRTKGFSAALVTNNYWLEGSAYAASKKDDGTDPLATESCTTEQFANGYVAAKLAPAFRQVISTDNYPTLDATKPVVAEITEAGYATLYVADTDLAIPEGVEAYAGVILNEGWLHLDAITGNAIAADEAVVLKGEAGYYSFAPTTGAEKAAENVLKGTAEETEAAGKYILAKPEGEAVGFYKANGTIKAGKAYLEAASEVKAFYFAGDGATGINEVNGQWSMANGQSVYNLAGQRINKMQKGVNIIGGKKVLH